MKNTFPTTTRFLCGILLSFFMLGASSSIVYAQCSDFTSGGTISGAQSICGSYNPSTISSVSNPSGGYGGTIEYMWMTNTTPSTTGAYLISGATSNWYDPPTITRTTYYIRCARRCGGNWAGESNWIKKEVTFCAPAPNCSGSNKWTWSQSINQSTGMPSSFRLGNWAGGVLYKDITSGFPSAASGPITVSITDAVSYDGYVGRTNTANQANERWRIKFYKGSSVVYTSPFTTDGITTGVEQDYWRGALGGSVFLANGFDKIRIEHYNVAYPSSGTSGSVVPVSFCVSYNACSALTNAGTISGNQTYCNSGNMSVSSSSVASGGYGGSIQYQWQWSHDGTTWTSFPSATGLSFSIGTRTVTHYFRRLAKRSDCGSWIPSNVVVHTVNKELTSAGTVSGDRTYCNSGNAPAFVSNSAGSGGSGGSVKYVWQYSTNNGATWVNMYSQTSATYDPGTLTATRWYRRQARRTTNCGNWLYSNVVKVTIDKPLTSAGTITGDQAYCNAANPPAFGSASAGSGGSGGTIQYQWRLSTNNGASWSNIGGATSSTYNHGALSSTTWFQRQARRTTACGSWLLSNIVKVTINGQLTSAGTIGSPQTFCNSGNVANLTNTTTPSGGSGGSVQYVWQKSTNNSTWSTISGATSSTYNPGTITTTTYYRRGAKRSVCGSNMYTSSVKVTVNKELTSAGAIGSPQTFCNSGNVANLTNTTTPSGGSGGSVQYAWQKSTNNSTWSTISGATSSTYNPGTITTTTYYRRGAKRSVCGSNKYTSSVKVTVNKELTSAGAIGSPQTFCNSGNVANLTNTTTPSGGSGGSIQYQWYSYVKGVGPWTAISGATSSTYNPPTITASTHYRRGAKRSVCGSTIYTPYITVTINKELTSAGAIGSPQTFCNSGNVANLTNTTTPSGGSGGSVQYVWQKSTNNSTWSTISGATSSTYNPGTITTTTYYRRGAKRSVCGSNMYTSSVKVTVNKELTSAGAIGSPQTFCNSGNPALFTNTTSASGGLGGTIAYQWQMSTNNTTWSNISGATSSTYNASSITTTTYYRRAAKRSVCGSYIYTPSVKVTINKSLVSGGTVGSNQTFCNSGNPALFTNTTSASGGLGGTISYQWQKRTGTSGSYSNISGATGVTYNAPSVSATTQYRRRAVRTSCAGNKYSNIVTVTVQPGVDAGSDGNTAVCDHSTATINLTSLITGEDAGGTWTRLTGTGGSFSASAGTYVPVVGATTSTFRYTVTGTAPCPNDMSVATVTINVCQIMISGNVFNDLDGLTDNDVDGTGIGNPSSTPIYANLVDASGNIVATTPIGSNGSYQFPNVTTNTTYTIELSQNQGTVGQPAPAIDLPGDWMNTGESPNNSTSDGTPNGVQTVSVGTSNIPNIDFGIQEPPTPGTQIEASQINPGGNVSVGVPSGSFSGTDPSGGTVTALRIVSFPTNTESITINGTTYTQANWPAAGVTIPTNAAGQPTWPITLDPVDGAVTATILYKSIDNAGVESPSTGYVKLPFGVIGISGNVYEDNNGETNVDGTGIGNPSSTPLYAHLVDASGKVVDQVTVAANGSYNFSEVDPNTTYTMVLSTTQGTVGQTAPTPDLPFGWNNVSEDCCDNTGNDGTTDGITTVVVGTSNVPNVNFGITQPLSMGNRVFNDLNHDGNRDAGESWIPGATVKLYEDANNDGTPDGAAISTATTSSTGFYRFDDLKPGNYIVGVTPPTPATGSAFESTEGPAQSSNPNDDVNHDDNGIITIGGETRSGTIVLAAGTEPTNDDTYNGVPDANSNMSIDFGFFQPIKLSGIVFNDESGPANVDGSPIGMAGTTQLYANLIKPDGTVEAVTPISSLGMYEFTDVDPNTAYKVVLTDAPGTVGNQEPAPSLPNGWVTVSEDCCDGVGNDGTHDGINYATTGTTDLPMVNFGIREPVSIGNSVWIDENQNGIKDAGETPLANAIVNIYEDNNNDGNPDGAAVSTMTTGADGLYAFNNLHAGKYIIGVVPPTIQDGAYESPTIGEETNPNLDVDNNDNGITKVGSEVRSGTINLVAGSEPTGEQPNNTSPVPDANANLTIDFGFYACPSSFQFDPVDLCLNTTFDLTSVEPTEFTGGVWTSNGQVVSTPTAVGTGTYTYNYNNGSCSATGSLLIADNVPDYTPTIQIAPSAITGTSQVRVILGVSEILNKESCSDLYVLVPKMIPRFTFQFLPNATSVGGILVSNADWEYYENANPNFYIWKYVGGTGTFPANGSVKLGYIGSYDPSNTDGQSTFSIQVSQGSGGETNHANNTDSDLLIYFR